ncbi:hypothetical protein PanWU01x14_039230 [Parasponia andersonii]|uniref:DUF1985 domain-containing protein n=1 Tax=Parasponia andersonii TaxID=3476 RepID=A0A2P5DQU0_PARAD|nr:hypothetical protein PanWU01x14_039230 [Parasponia andersonii]
MNPAAYGLWEIENSRILLGQVVQEYVLLREVEQPNEEEMWFDIRGPQLRFSINEFALITGLKCHQYPKITRGEIPGNRILAQFFGSFKTVNREQLDATFHSCNSSNDEDCVKALANRIPKFREKLKKNPNHQSETYHLAGFPFALQPNWKTVQKLVFAQDELELVVLKPTKLERKADYLHKVVKKKKPDKDHPEASGEYVVVAPSNGDDEGHPDPPPQRGGTDTQFIIEDGQ